MSVKYIITRSFVAVSSVGIKSEEGVLVVLQGTVDSRYLEFQGTL